MFFIITGLDLTVVTNMADKKCLHNSVFLYKQLAQQGEPASNVAFVL